LHETKAQSSNTKPRKLSAHIDDLLVVGSKAYIKDFYKKLSQELKLKIEGPLQPGDEGSIFYLKRELQFNEGGIDATPSSKYIAKLAELLKVSDRRGRAVPHHGCLQIYDPESISQGEYLDAENSKLFRSALGICFYVTQERCDIQHPVRILATYMAKPTQLAMNGLKKLTSYLIQTKDMRVALPSCLWSG
jgi:hypothetical protein